MVHVTEELQLKICCSVKKKQPNSLYYSTLEHFSGSLSGCKPQACLNFMLRWGVCLASFLFIFLSPYLLSFLASSHLFFFFFSRQKFSVCPGWEPLLSLGSCQSEWPGKQSCWMHRMSKEVSGCIKKQLPKKPTKVNAFSSGNCKFILLSSSPSSQLVSF